MSQPSSQPFGVPPQAPAKRSILPYVIGGIAVALVMMFAVCGVGAYFVAKNVDKIKQAAKQNQAAKKIVESDWGKRTVDKVTLEAPCEFGPGPNVAGELPQEVRAMIQSMMTYQGLGTPESFQVLLSQATYVPEVEANLEGAVHGAVTETASRLGDPKPVYDSEPIVVSGVEGRRSHYKRTIDGQLIHFETVTVCKENRLWQVQVIRLDSEPEALADRVFNSVEIDYATE